MIFQIISLFIKQSLQIFLQLPIVLLLIFVTQIQLKKIRCQFQILLQPSILWRISWQLLPSHNKVMISSIDNLGYFLVYFLLIRSVVATTWRFLSLPRVISILLSEKHNDVLRKLCFIIFDCIQNLMKLLLINPLLVDGLSWVGVSPFPISSSFPQSLTKIKNIRKLLNFN